jgi:hypothetical protein
MPVINDAVPGSSTPLDLLLAWRRTGLTALPFREDCNRNSDNPNGKIGDDLDIMRVFGDSNEVESAGLSLG